MANAPLARNSHRVQRWFRQLLTASPLAALASLALMPSLGRASESEPPTVDLAHISISDGVAHAPAADGATAELTLDAHLQHTAVRLLARAAPVRGAIILVDAHDGRVLVWAERTANGEGDGAVMLHALAPSASVFKVITTTALLERGKVSSKHRVCTSGGLRRIERKHLDAPRPGTPDVHCARFFSALGHSKNAVYAQLATHFLTRNDLVEVADRFGLNHPVPFDVPVPTGHLEVPYNDLEFARASAGFVGSTLSPLGALELAYTVAAHGSLPRVRIVRSVGDWHAPAGRTLVRRVMHDGTAYELRRMMEVTVHAGTSLEAFSDKDKHSYFGAMRLAGKTGTLQLSDDSPTTSRFVGFAPSRAPDVVVSVQLDNGKVWRRKANEVARDMLRAYFATKNTPGVTAPF